MLLGRKIIKIFTDDICLVLKVHAKVRAETILTIFIDTDVTFIFGKVRSMEFQVKKERNSCILSCSCSLLAIET